MAAASVKLVTVHGDMQCCTKTLFVIGHFQVAAVAYCAWKTPTWL